MLVTLVVSTGRNTIYPDPKDKMFLWAAVNGGAEIIVRGDDDLLELEAFERIPIITPEEFLVKPG